MEITSVEPILIQVPYEHGAPKPAMGSGEIRTHMDAILVRVETDGGVTGWGEAFGFATTPVTIPAIREAIAPRAVGRDPADIEGLTTTIKRQLQNMMHGGPARFALSALDIALWDIKGKAEGAPIWRLLGGKEKDRVPAYASLLRLIEPDTVARITQEAHARGYKQIKLHEKTAEAVAAARRALGPDIPLMVDTNCAWSPEDAIKMARKMKPHRLAWLEEPITPPDDYDALARLRQETGVPIAIGENLGNPNDVRWLAKAGAVDIVQPSVVKLGGISDVWKTIAFAKGQGLRVVPHSPFIGPGLIATIHLIAAMDEDVPCEHRYCDLEMSPMGEFFSQEEGCLRVPKGPGLGVDPDQEAIDRYRVR
ncbi:MAG: mandelate racemase/muconate lactonizing enzyme family protein [Alphaproteobacteria bacterium]|nr:mandelate racemase/muconate lactonizing enzyme family protein [Alphaproteobacteria bacterium]